ncbi:MAG TPA: hypothetical protein VN672_10830 [Solirubrobacteraceae bacterium]|nr:hypothetical protein [Solirubrobacteraceae bacterium]
MPTYISWQRLGVLLAALAAVLAAGCGSAAEDGRTQVAAVVEKDFAISTPRQLPAGEVDLHVRNDGPDEHELIVARIGPRGLPMRTDGLTLDEEALERDEPGALEPGAPGGDRTLSVKLTPGRYVFFCNMAGHYMGGMHTEVVVQ